jgi:asparagine synthase (glutamine-hydrolysing)
LIVVCGISGWIFEDPERAETARSSIDAYMKASLDAMTHRGPDSGGMARLSTGSIGARRLAIIDVAGGDQPIYNEDGSVVAVLNGEIYNFADLRNRLAGSGHRFQTKTDTEVLVHGYEEWGLGLPERLEGMFAFAVWDDSNKVLLAARDRLGKKPFFYAGVDGGFRFASEIKALLADGHIRPEPDYKNLLVLLTLQHLPPPLAPLEDIRQLRPGEALVLKDGRLSTRIYWDIVEVAAHSAASPLSDPRPAEVLERIEEAAVRRTTADVPIGIFLSGGIDSSLVAAVLHRAGHALETFSVGFADARFDETPNARVVARHIGSVHTDMLVETPSREDIANIVWYLDEPLADSSSIPQFQICKAASSRLKVVISGDGGDEFFGGYLKHRRYARLRPLLSAASLVPGWVSRVLGDAVDGSRPTRLSRTSSLIESLVAASGRTTRQISRALALARLKEADAYLDYLTTFPSFERRQIAGPQLADRIGADALEGPPSETLDRVSRCPSGLGILWRLGLIDALTELPGDILVKVDRMSMANSLEVRSPLLDHKLVEWAFSLPDRARYRRGETKPLLRDAARMVLPPQIADAPKRGFGVPLSEWMRGDLGVLTAEVLLDGKTGERGWIQRSAAERLLSANLAGADMGPRLWQLLVLELWARAYLDSSPPSPPVI